MPITRRLHNVTLKAALRLMLRDLDLTYVIQEGVLLITTVDQAETPELLSIRVYPVGDLAHGSYEELVTVITTSVLPNTWSRVGGNATITEMATCKSLVISQAISGHEEILRLLRALRAAKKQLPPTD